MTKEMHNEVTKFLLTVCYHCEDAQRCKTEEQCRACMADIFEELHKEQQREQTTEELLKQYAL